MCSFWRTLSAYMLRHTALKPTAISRVLQALMSTRPQVSRPRPQHSRWRPKITGQVLTGPSATHMFIHMWNEPVLPSRRPSPHFRPAEGRRLSWVGWLVPEMVTTTSPSINRAGRRVTWLMRPATLSLHHTAASREICGFCCTYVCVWKRKLAHTTIRHYSL